ncbi:hypothetical protein LTR84_005241 [Exophiala bonariae]|uniref:AB hydrolase-1 domain-containing protein n=1 Tax=Exophiala bonariae TaxID=1690606 RepID=A0AAV9NT75_9EURO|nr:hypothetical protein LTR84_005241 [Exophiala bonariae]
MPYFQSTTDGARLHYVEYNPSPTPAPTGEKAVGTAAPVPAPAPRFAISPTRDLSGLASGDPNGQVTLVFIHGWPMSHRMFEHMLLRLSETHGVRCVASDRRGFGDSEWTGCVGKGETITYDTFARDTVDFLSAVQRGSRGLGAFYFVAASMGCGETALAYRLLLNAVDDPAALDLKSRCRGFVWLGPSLPFPLRTERNPSAPPRELWDAILQGFRDDRVGFVRAAIPGVFGEGFGIGVELAPTVKERFERIVERADALAIERCVQIIAGTDLTDVVRGLDCQDGGGDGHGVRLLVVHGDSDQSMPAESSANIIPTLVTQAQVKIYKNAAHGLYLTHADELLDDILTFVFGK